MENLRPDDDMSKSGVKFDDGKLAMHLLPPELLEAVSAILAHGAKKYDERNWEKGMSWSRPYAAILRHLFAWWRKEELDKDSGMPHLWHVATNVAFLIAYQQRGTGKDDRP